MHMCTITFMHIHFSGRVPHTCKHQSYQFDKATFLLYRSYLQFGAEKTALLLQIPDTYVAAAILLSWKQPCDAECIMPDVVPTPRTASSETILSRKSSELWVKLCSENSMIELNRGSDYQSYTAIVGQIDGWLHRASVASSDKPIPLMFGPVKSDKISTVQKFKEFASSESGEYLESDSVAECFLSVPVNSQGTYVHTHMHTHNVHTIQLA